MANTKGTYTGALLAKTPPQQPASWAAGADVQLLAWDFAELAAAPVADTVELGTFPVDTRIHPDSTIKTDAMGTSVTLSVGDATHAAALAAAASVSSAGSRSICASVDIANEHKPLWELLGYASRAAAIAANSKGITLYATIGGAAATGTVTWLIKGYRP